jgi:hypothetical protein
MPSNDLGKDIAGQRIAWEIRPGFLTMKKNAEQTLKNTFGSLFNKKKEQKDSMKRDRIASEFFSSYLRLPVPGLLKCINDSLIKPF